jgi:REP element-mobilizing transposase RayT
LDAGYSPVRKPQAAGIILEVLRYRQKENGWKINSYVILENHLHMIVQSKNLAMELPHFKFYTARQLIDHLKECRAERLLQQLAFFRKDHKRQDRNYQCWEEESHPQLIENGQVLRQKLEYIHQNPVKRGYVDDPTHWRYSSAWTAFSQTFSRCLS